MTIDSPDSPCGVFAAALTRLDSELNVDLAATLDHYRWLLAQGCDGLAVLGTTDEANSFSLGERLVLIEAVAKAGLPADKLLIGTGCCALPDTIALTRAALDHGFRHILMLPPFYYKGASDEGLHAAFARVIDAVNDPDIRVYLYHFPKMSGVLLGHELIARLRASHGQAIAGIKDSSGDLGNMQAMCEKFPGFAVYAGTERYLQPVLEAGGVGCISATANATSRHCQTVFAAWQESGAAERQQDLTAIREVFDRYPLVGALKEVWARRTTDDAWRRLRPPLTALAAAAGDELDQALAAAGLGPFEQPAEVA